MPERNEELEQAIPVEWRPAIMEIVEAIRNRNLRSRNVSGYEVSVDPAEIEDIYRGVDYYGDTLVSLSEDTWQTSVCRWMGSYWHLLIDLFTAEEGLSDLVLFLDVYEHESSTTFKVQSLHIP
jgi:hypothetical protein